MPNGFWLVLVLCAPDQPCISTPLDLPAFTTAKACFAASEEMEGRSDIQAAMQAYRSDERTRFECLPTEEMKARKIKFPNEYSEV